MFCNVLPNVSVLYCSFLRLWSTYLLRLIPGCRLNAKQWFSCNGVIQELVMILHNSAELHGGLWNGWPFSPPLRPDQSWAPLFDGLNLFSLDSPLGFSRTVVCFDPMVFLRVCLEALYLALFSSPLKCKLLVESSPVVSPTICRPMICSSFLVLHLI